jgi:hypothetical protein
MVWQLKNRPYPEQNLQLRPFRNEQPPLEVGCSKKQMLKFHRQADIVLRNAGHGRA